MNVVKRLQITSSVQGADKTAADLNKVAAAQRGVAVEADKTTRSTLSVERALEKHQRQLDASYRSTKMFERAERDLNTARAQGLITAQRHTELMGLAAAKADAAAASARRLASATTAATTATAGMAASIKAASASLLSSFAGPLALVTALPFALQKAVGAAGDLADAAGRAGVSAEKLQVLRYAIEQTGGEAADADSALTKFTVGVGRLGTIGGGPAATALKAIGVNVRDASGAMRDTGVVFDEVVDKLSQIESRAAVAGLAASIFGREAGPKMATLLMEGRDALDGYEAALRRSGGMMSNETAAAADVLDDKFKTLTRTVSTLAMTIAVDLAGALDSYIANNQKVASNLEAFVNNPSLQTYARFMLGDYAAFLGVKAPSTWGGGLTVPDLGVVEDLGPTAAELASAVESIVDQIAGSLIPYTDALKERFSDAFGTGTSAAAETTRAVTETTQSIATVPPAIERSTTAAVRFNDEIKRTQDLGDAIRDSLGGAIEGLFSGGIKSAEDFLDAVTSAIASAAARIMTTRLMPGASLGGGTAGVGGIAAQTMPISSGSGALTDIAGYIRQRAAAMGIDPAVALGVAASEGGTDGQWRVGDAGKSFGPYQLYTGGGLGNVFQSETGLALTPDTIRQQIDFSLNKAVAGGWGPWHGWKGSSRAGLGGASTLPITGGGLPASASVPTVGEAVPVSVVDAPAPAFSGISKIIQSPFFQQGVAGFSMGYASKSPVMGGLGGALSGLLAGGPVGAIVGGAAGILGGIFGKSQAEKQALEEAKKAWEAMADEVALFSDELRGKVMGDLGSTLYAAEQRFKKYEQAAKDAGESTGQLAKDLDKFRRDQKAEFKEMFALRAAAYRSGLGEDDPALKAALAMKALRKELMGFVSDAKLVGKGKEAKGIAQDYTLSQLAQTDTTGMDAMALRNLSQQQVTFLVKDLKMKEVDAWREVNAAMSAAIAQTEQIQKDAADLRKVVWQDKLFEMGLDLATLDGQRAQLDRQYMRDRAEEIKAGGGALLELDTYYAQAKLKIAEDFHKQEVEAARRAAEEAESELNRTARSIVDYVNDLLSGPQSTSSPQDRFAAAQTAYSGQLALAQSGNIDAQAGITKFADNLLEAAEAMYASSAQFQVIRSQVIAQLSALPAVQQATDPVVVELRNTNAAIVAMQGAVVTAIGGLAASIAGELSGKFDTLDTSIDGVLDYGEFVTGLKDSTTLLGGLLTPAKMTTLGLDKNSTLGTLLDAADLADKLTKAGLDGGAKIGDILALGDMNGLGLDKTSTLGQLLNAGKLAAELKTAGFSDGTKLGDILAQSDMNALGLDKKSTLGELLTAGKIATELKNAGLGDGTKLGDILALSDMNTLGLDKNATLGSILSAGEAARDKLKEIYTSIDLNGDKQISFLEAQLVSGGVKKEDIAKAFAANDPKKAFDFLKPYFDKIDADGSGGISKTEMLDVLDTTKVDQLFKALDGDNDGILNIKEATADTESNTGPTGDLRSAMGDLAMYMLWVNGAIVDNLAPKVVALTTEVGKVNTNTDITAKKNWDQASANVLAKFIPMIAFRLVEQSQMLAEAKGVETKRAGGWDLELFKKENGFLNVRGPGTFLPGGALFSHGGIVGAYAPGGVVGNGVWNMDSVRARFAGGGDILLAGGEGILNAQAMKMIGPSAFDLMNRTGRIPGNDNGPHFRMLADVTQSTSRDEMRVATAVGRATLEALDALRAEVRQLRAAAEGTTRAVKEKPAAKPVARMA